MKAAVYTQYGSPDVLKLQEVTKPTPKPDEIRVRVRATAVNFGDLLARNIKKVGPRSFSMPGIFWFPTVLMFGIRKPKITILGSEFSGDVEAVGESVKQFKVGDAVIGYRGPLMGANAEYVCIKQNGMVAPKPRNMGYEEAATVPYGAITALSLLRKANIQPSQKVLINGASGGIGSYAVQIAKHFGAEVTGVCGTQRVAFVKSLGADKVIDYSKEDFTRSGESYDLIFDVIRKTSFGKCQRVLKPKGRYMLVSFKMWQVFQALWTSLRGGKRVMCAMSGEKQEDLAYIAKLVEEGHLTSVVDRAFPLAQAAEAHRYMEGGQRTGHVVITV